MKKTAFFRGIFALEVGLQPELLGCYFVYEITIEI